MAATKQDIAEWFDQGVEQEMVRMIVCTDTFSMDDYPVYLGPEDEREAKIMEIEAKEFTQIMEVYDLTADKEAQLSEDRTWR